MINAEESIAIYYTERESETGGKRDRERERGREEERERERETRGHLFPCAAAAVT